MPSHLLIAVFGSRAFLQTHGFKNSIFTKLFFDTQQSILKSAFFGKLGVFGCLLFCQRLVIGKEPRLFLDFFRNIAFVQNVVRPNGNLPYQQIGINLEVNKTKSQNSPTLKNSQKFVKWGQWLNTRSNSEKVINFEITDFSMYGDFLPKIDASFL